MSAAITSVVNDNHTTNAMYLDQNIDDTTNVVYLEYNIDGAEFEKLLQEDTRAPVVLTDWSVRAIGRLCYGLEKLQSENVGKRFFASTGHQKLATKAVVLLANNVFGFNGWSSEVILCDIDSEDFDDENMKHSVSVQVLVRVTLKGGIIIEEVGRSTVSNMPRKVLCYQLGKKKAFADGLKRAIMGLRDLYLEYEAEEKKCEVGAETEGRKRFKME